MNNGGSSNAKTNALCSGKKRRCRDQPKQLILSAVSVNSVTPVVHTELMNTPHVERAEAGREVVRCPGCRRPVVPIAYGYPGPEMFEAAERGEIILGGCTIDARNPTHSCACGATTSGAIDNDDELGAFGIDEARSYIVEVRWQIAKTMPQWPHEYTVRDWRPDLDDTFEAFAACTRSEGVVKPWPRDSPTPRYHHQYLAIDGWDYWIMDGPVTESKVINRARLDDTWQ